MSVAVPLDDDVAAVRGFNRFYTRNLGLLASGFLDSDHSLTEVRVLYELAQQDELEVVELRARMGIDAGYLSRLLSRFADDGLVAKARSAADGRRQVVQLTASGRATFAVLDRRQHDEMAAQLAGLDAGQRRRLLGSMAAIQAVLEDPGGEAGAGAVSPGPVVLRPAGSGDLGWIVHRHGALYASAYGWGETYEAFVARVVADMVEARAASPGRVELWVAEVDGEPVGSIGCAERDADTAQLRLLLVEPSARRGGLGRQLIEHCLRFARTAGYRRVALWTNDNLVEARRLYEKAGFALDDESPHDLWGQGLVSQTWSRDV
ncbi:MAG TPA: helix-turn-helix domain-containing GNAT family N-acetyltransferase [Acidimicrobiales bacterium]|nr:helix-turn-helix domain-containing GNAT family N-acetyltransferase [Acidimicrobiales bacterium]